MALVHASPGDLWRVIPRDSSDAELEETFGSLGCTVAAYCHIHLPYVRQLDRMVVANSGSVGMPFDGDWRASYLVIDDGRVEIRRVEYDLERELDNLRRSSIPDAAVLAAGRRLGRAPHPPR
jgi:hypothetical protein